MQRGRFKPAPFSLIETKRDVADHQHCAPIQKAGATFLSRIVPDEPSAALDEKQIGSRDGDGSEAVKDDAVAAHGDFHFQRAIAGDRQA